MKIFFFFLGLLLTQLIKFSIRKPISANTFHSKHYQIILWKLKIFLITHIWKRKQKDGSIFDIIIVHNKKPEYTLLGQFTA